MQVPKYYETHIKKLISWEREEGVYTEETFQLSRHM